MEPAKRLKILGIVGLLSLFAVVSAQAALINISGTIRDFKDSHPDFESRIKKDRGIVEKSLGADKKPVYAGIAGNPTTHGQAAFDQWYRDVSGVNRRTVHEITLDSTITSDPKMFTFSDRSFFPIDNQLFGNQGRRHNYHFTLEMHGRFDYKGGEKLTFKGDDDLWIFINNQLVIDLGGVHPSQRATVNLDAIADQIGILPGKSYDFDLFFAERHTWASRFTLDTNLELRPIPLPSVMWLFGSGVFVLWGAMRKGRFNG